MIGVADASLWRSEDEGTYARPGVYAHIEELIVTATHRRRGAATALLGAAETWATDAGARMVWVDTHLAIEGARTLYRQDGYLEFGVVVKKEL